MTQTASAAAQPAPPPPLATAVPAGTPQPAPTGSAVASAPASLQPSRTPRLLRRLDAAVLALGVAFAVAGLISYLLLALALGRAADSTAQLIRVQQIQTSMLSADATATNAFLVGGLEPTAQRQTYDQAIDTASVLIAQAGRAEPADEQALSVLNEQLVAYAAAVEQARANNRQGFPIGAQYLRSASATLRADTLPVLDNLVAANAERAASQMDVDAAWLFGVVGLLGLAGLVVIQVWLARRFRRRLNRPLVTATAIGLVVWLGLVLSTSGIAAVVAGVRTGDFADVNAAATARIRGFDAKSNESLTLIARGSGASFEKAWAASAATVTQNLTDLPSEVGRSWQAYVAVHRQIRQLDDGGAWDQAVTKATATGAGSANATFADYDRRSAAVVESSGSEAIDTLRGQRIGLWVAAFVALAAGAAIAVLGRRGIAARLQEYR